MSQKKLFISHAAKDKDLADALVDFIETGTPLKSDEIFCSSLQGLGIPSGEDFISYIKGQIQEPESVILLLTPNYFASAFCLCEMGASWAMAHNILPLLVPPLTYDDIEGVLSVTQIDKLDDSDDLNKFVTQLKEDLSLSDLNLPRWETKKKKFLKALPAVLKGLPLTDSVSIAAHEDLKKKYDDALNELDNYECEMDQLKELIKELKHCKDSSEVKEVERRFSSTLDMLDKKFGDLKDRLRILPNVVAVVMYKEFVGENAVPFPLEDRDLVRDADSALEDDYLSYDGEEYGLNHDDPSIRDAWCCLEQLDDFVSNDLSEDDFSIYESKAGFSLSLSNRRLWRKEIAEHIPKY